MTKFLLRNLIIFIITLYLSKNLFAEENILPKPQPKIDDLQKLNDILKSVEKK